MNAVTVTPCMSPENTGLPVSTWWSGEQAEQLYGLLWQNRGLCLHPCWYNKNLSFRLQRRAKCLPQRAYYWQNSVSSPEMMPPRPLLVNKKPASVYWGAALPAELMLIPRKWHNRACTRNVHVRRGFMPRRAPLSWAQRPFKENNRQLAEQWNTWLSGRKVGFFAEPFDVTVKMTFDLWDKTPSLHIFYFEWLCKIPWVSGYSECVRGRALRGQPDIDLWPPRSNPSIPESRCEVVARV